MDTDTSSMRPFVVKDLVQTVMDRKVMSFDDAVSYVYSSELYMKLLDEESKMWYWSTATLYDMLEEEKYYKRRTKLSGKNLMFRVFCLETYCDKLDLYHEDVLSLFRQYDVFDFLDDTFEVLHTQDESYIIETIQRYIKKRRREK